MIISFAKVTSPTWLGSLFSVAAAYDIVLGLVFVFFYEPILETLDVDLPANTSYIHLAAVFVLVQGISYLFIYRDIAGNLDMIRVGILYKAAYAAVAVYYLAIDDLLHWVFLLFGVLDLAFMALFIAALITVNRSLDASEGDGKLA